MPKTHELVFALKTFAGAMAALYIAFRLGLENPYWAMATAYIVAQPFTGAMRSKAQYRFFGTLLGAAAAVALVPNLVDAPVLLCLGLAVWIGLCLYLALLDRTPRAYTFMLAGYTAGIIGFPSVGDPAGIFTTALTRVEEIGLGIACTTFFGSVFFPRALGPVLAARIRAWVRPGTDWALQALAGNTEDAVTRDDRRRLAVEAADIGMMTSQLAYDASALATATAHIIRLRLYMLSLMPVFSSIGDRMRRLTESDGITPPVAEVVAACAGWVKGGRAEGADGLRRALDSLPAEDAATWPSLLRLTLVPRLHEMISLIEHSRLVRAFVMEGAPAPPAAVLRGEYVAAPHLVRDHGLALFSAAAATLSTLLVCGFWIETGWAAGGGAAVMVAVACSFFAAQDDPAPAILQMLRNALIVAVLDAVYVFAVLPHVESFAALFLVLLPAGLVVGVLVSRPASFGTGMVLGAVGSTILALQNGYRGDFAAYLNAALALVAGLAAAVVITRLVRSVGAAWSARRLLRAGWRDIAAAAQTRQDRAHLTGVMLDRMGLLMPRLASVAPAAELAAADVLTDLRVGLNILDLRHALDRLPPPARDHAGGILAAVAAHYRANPLAPPERRLLGEIDAAIACLARPPALDREALLALVGLRILLFADAPPPLPAPGPAAVEALAA